MYKDENGIPQKKFHFELKYDTFVGKPKEDVRSQYENDTYLDNEGTVVRWIKSDNVVPEDFLYDFRDLGYITDAHIEASLVQKDLDTTKFITEYIESNERFKREEPELYAESQREMMFEASAAYGPGEEVVNIFTGDTFTTK